MIASAYTLRAIAMRSIAAGLAWWALSEGDIDSWAVGGVTVLSAVAASLWLAPRPAGSGIRPRALASFAGFFLVQSLRAGLQVAALAFSPPGRIVPGSAQVILSLPPGPPRYLLAGTVSLLPGTLSVKLKGARLLIHALTDPEQAAREVRALETRISPLFGDAE